MPRFRRYRRRYVRRRRYQGRRRFRRTGLRRRVNFIQRKVSGIQYKRGDTQYVSAATQPGTTGDALIVNQIPVGQGESQRIALRIRCVRLTIRGYMIIGSNGVPSTVRFVVVHWKQPNGQGVSDILTEYFTGISINQFKANNFRFQHRTLADFRVTVNPNGGNERTFVLQRRLNIKTSYNANDDTGATIETGAIVVLMFSNITGAGNVPAVVWRSRLSYLDA